MKKRLLIVSALVLVLAILGAGTLAYFTSSATAHNVVTTGGVGITLVEKMLDADGKEVDFTNQNGIMPGQSVSKIVRVLNNAEKSAEAWIRVKVEKAVTVDGKELDASVITMDFNTTDWTEKDGWFYYNKSVMPGDETTNLFTKVNFAGVEMDNAYQNATVTVTVSAQAVQTKNNGTTVLTAAGWPIA